jgi:hypothetical protein
MPASSGRSAGDSAASAPNAPSTWNQISRARRCGQAVERVDCPGVHGTGGTDDEERLQAGRAIGADRGVKA